MDLPRLRVRAGGAWAPDGTRVTRERLEWSLGPPGRPAVRSSGGHLIFEDNSEDRLDVCNRDGLQKMHGRPVFQGGQGLVMAGVAGDEDRHRGHLEAAPNPPVPRGISYGTSSILCILSELKILAGGTGCQRESFASPVRNRPRKARRRQSWKYGKAQ